MFKILTVSWSSWSLNSVLLPTGVLVVARELPLQFTDGAVFEHGKGDDGGVGFGELEGEQLNLKGECIGDWNSFVGEGKVVRSFLMAVFVRIRHRPLISSLSAASNTDSICSCSIC